MEHWSVRGNGWLDWIDPDTEHGLAEILFDLVVQWRPVLSVLGHETFIPVHPECSRIVGEGIEDFPFTMILFRKEVEMIGLDRTNHIIKRSELGVL